MVVWSRTRDKRRSFPLGMKNKVKCSEWIEFTLRLGCCVMGKTLAEGWGCFTTVCWPSSENTEMYRIIWDNEEFLKLISINVHLMIIYRPPPQSCPLCYLCADCSMCSGRVCFNNMLCVSEKSNIFLKDPTDLMTNMYGDTLVTTNGKHTQNRALSQPADAKDTVT